MNNHFVWSKSENISNNVRTTRYEQLIARSQEFEREALKLAAFAEKHAEGSVQYQQQMKKAEQAHREGSRYYAAATKELKHA